MQSTYTGHITRSEWRWVIWLSVIFLGLALVPLLLASAATDAQFAGAIHQFREVGPELARMRQGAEGDWLVHFLHTPDYHPSAFVEPVYVFLGHISNLSGLPIILVFHLARFAASLFMYVAIYQLGATIWVKVRTRRIFFFAASLGSGLGWLDLVLMGTGNVHSMDFLLAPAYPFFASLVNVHYPLGISVLALLTAALLPALRPGAAEDPGVNNSGIVGLLMSILLAVVYPEALLPFFLAMFASMGYHWWVKRHLTVRELRWALWIVIPALPVVIYDLIAIQINPAVAAWYAQRPTNPINLWYQFMGIGLPLLLAVPGIWRAVRRFESDGDRFMLLWLIAIMLCLNSGLAIAQDCVVGLMLPLSYFVARSLEDFWFRLVARRFRRRLFVFAVPAFGLSHLFVLLLPVVLILRGTAPVGMLLPPAYIAAFQWLDEQTVSRDVILAAPDVSIWVPLWTGSRVYYAHPNETMQADERRTLLFEWFGAEDAEQCIELASDLASIDYVIYGPLERHIGDAPCRENFQLYAVFNDVRIYGP